MGSFRSLKSQAVQEDREEQAKQRRLALGKQLVQYSIFPNDVRKVGELIRSGAPLDFVHPEWGMTPLTMAVMRSSPSARLLLRNGANPNLICRQGATPLILAVGIQNVEMVKLLLRKGADPNLGGSTGRTPLNIALESSNREIVEILMKAGARP